MIVADGALSGRVAVVTGASSGIGLATANRLHDLGASVTALARRREAMAEGVGDRDIDLRAVDVTDREATAAALDHERIDALILAAGTNVKDRVLAGLSPRAGTRRCAPTSTASATASARRCRRCGPRRGSS